MEPKNIAICIDGTDNHPDQAKEEGEDTTNVYRLYDALIQNDVQVAKYFEGVGTSEWKMWDLKGELYGLGSKKIRKEAYKFLSAHYEAGDNIFIFGFSRGAAIARDLTNAISDKGIGQIRTVPIKLLGLWDTVAAFGIPVDILGLPTQSINLGKKLDIPSNVNKTYHLLSIDERRTPFIPTLVEVGPNVEEIWFSGVHSDVGGGYDNRKLADITLRFMIECTKPFSLYFTKKKIDSIPDNPYGEGEIHGNQGKFPVSVREIVVRENNNASVNTKPKIHNSVIARMSNQEYKPENVVKLNGNYETIK